MEIDDWHGIGFGFALFRCPIGRNADQVVDAVFLILRETASEDEWALTRGTETDQTHALIRIHDLTQDPVDHICHRIQYQWTSLCLGLASAWQHQSQLLETHIDRV